jgi:hypothetical protein
MYFLMRVCTLATHVLFEMGEQRICSYTYIQLTISSPLPRTAFNMTTPKSIDISRKQVIDIY